MNTNEEADPNAVDALECESATRNEVSAGNKVNVECSVKGRSVANVQSATVKPETVDARTAVVRLGKLAVRGVDAVVRLGKRAAHGVDAVRQERIVRTDVVRVPCEAATMETDAALSEETIVDVEMIEACVVVGVAAALKECKNVVVEIDQGVQTDFRAGVQVGIVVQ